MRNKLYFHFLQIVVPKIVLHETISTFHSGLVTISFQADCVIEFIV